MHILTRTLQEIRQTSSMNQKQVLLSKVKDNKDARKLLFYALNPFITFGVSKLPPIKIGINEFSSGWAVDKFIDILNHLHSRYLTSNAAKLTLSKFISNYNKDDADLLMCVIERDLKAGMSVKTINKVFGKDFIPEFEVQLCNKITIEDLDKIKLPVYAEPKLDGVRLLATGIKNSITFLSRNGKEKFFSKIVKLLNKCLGGGLLLDGEIYTGKGFQKLMTQTNRKYNRKEVGEKYLVFDMVDDKTLEGENDLIPLKERRKELERWYKSNRLQNSAIQLVPQIIVEDVKSLLEVHKEYLLQGYEGTVIKPINSLYKPGRNKTWFKLKPEKEQDCKILKVNIGKGKFANTMGALTVLQENKNRCNVGSGFSYEQRTWFWKNRKIVIDTVVEVKYQELSEDKIMRFPVFKRLREDK